MAVQDGYGKSSGSESLVFAYDLKDTVNSYRGEPATNSQNADISSMTQVGFDSWSCYDGSPPYHTWGTNQSKTFVTIPGPFGASVNAMLYHNFNGGFYGPTDWGGVPNGTITAGRTYTVQGWVKAADSNSIGKTVKPYTYYSHSGGAYSAGTNYTLTDQWQLVSHTHTVQYNATSGGIMYFFTENSGAVKMYLTMTGVFLDKSHAVPWIVGGSTRGNTQGLLDLTGNGSIDLSRVSFDSNTQMTFDGTDDKITVDCTGLGVNTYNSTTEFIIQLPYYSGGQRCIMSYRGNSGGDLYIGKGSNGIFSYYNSLSNAGYTVGYIADGSIAHVAVVCDAGNNLIKHYINGSLTGSASRTGWVSSNHTSFTLGYDPGGTNEYMDGKMYKFAHYNRVLTSTEITNNYLKYKRQYGLT